AKNFTDLAVYQKAMTVAHTVYESSKTFPPDERYSLTDQIRRSSRSIGAQIAEAWGKRRYQRHFVSKLTDADSEQLETQHWVSVAVSCGYVDGETEMKLLSELAEIGRMLQSMISNAESFCDATRNSVRENLGDYFESSE
ncbi:four helix bundle protein, partial [Acidobacteriota bacterium]